MKFVSYHLGLGDAILCSGLINYLSEKEEITIPCYLHNYKSVHDVHLGNPNVRIITVRDQADIEYIEKNIYPQKTMKLNGSNFPKGFYGQADVPWKERWDSCPVYEVSRFKSGIAGAKDIIIHDDISRGFCVDVDGSHIKNDGFSVLDYTPSMIKAKEIHCIDSSFLHLVECIPPDKFLNNPKFFYHKSARPHSTDYTGCLKHNWEVV